MTQDLEKEFDEKFYRNDNPVWMGRGEIIAFIKSREAKVREEAKKETELEVSSNCAKHEQTHRREEWERMKDFLKHLSGPDQTDGWNSAIEAVVSYLGSSPDLLASLEDTKE